MITNHMCGNRQPSSKILAHTRLGRDVKHGARGGRFGSFQLRARPGQAITPLRIGCLHYKIRDV